jgi:hypothetical protein
MRSLGVLLLMALAAAQTVSAAESPAPTSTAAAGGPSGNQMIATIRGRLLAAFEQNLTDPKAYEQTALKECHLFPEGDLFPFIFPAYAYTNLALQGKIDRPTAQARVAAMIDLALPHVIKRVRPPQGKLENLKDYARHATYLGQFNTALGCYRLIGGDDRYAAIHKHLSDLLHAALVERDGRPLESFPEYSWPFDTIPCLVSLKLYDAQTGTDRSVAITQKHLVWVREHATDPATGLPWSRIDNATGRGTEQPRGCDLALRLMYLAQLDPDGAKALYAKFTEGFWLVRGAMAGFAEWPGGATKSEDLDSGPIVQGVGMSATGFGIGAATAMNDRDRLQRLGEQLLGMKQMMQAMKALMPPDQQSAPMKLIAIDDRYVTGFLYGDVCLFYSITWTPWQPK